MKIMAKTPYREKPAEIHARNLNILKDRIKENKFGGSYVFYGDEEYMKNHYYSLLRKSCGDETLNVTTITGSDFTLASFMNACETGAVESFDMFSDGGNSDVAPKKRLIRLISPDLSVLTKKDSEFFLDTLSSLSEDCIVIFWFYAGDSETFGKGIYKSICEHSLVVNFKQETVGSPVLITWILRHFSKAKLNVDRSVAVYLCSVVGASMTDLKNEIQKCIDYLKIENRDTLTNADVDFLCIKSTQAQIFDISAGALQGNFAKAAKALGVLRDKKEKPLLILGTISKAIGDLCTVDKLLRMGIPAPEIPRKAGLFDFIVKNDMAVLSSRNQDFKGNDSFAKTAASLCLEYDDKLKSSRTDGYELLFELIFRLSLAGKVKSA